jgi:hypothetical protein
MAHVHVRWEVARQTVQANHAFATDRRFALDVRDPRRRRGGRGQAFQLYKFVLGKWIAH